MYQEMTRGIPATTADPKAGVDVAWTRARASDKARRAAQASHASGRRRNVDPTTTDRDYSPEEMEFLRAMQEYKRRSGRMFPTWSEVLEVLLSLGYRKPMEAEEHALAGPEPAGLSLR
ncbi:hypothetical protein [Tautonia plasticadhaerens]|uniref:Uncharacterized protein n=1 Tax=Tautonia plasticadhaerens TaxID=2527974 RepID=A0A518GYY2_9BACT|nr:hypothetical protein [Tautonia plasticadhaerens]QDV33808.1 hypothetical protein ElP_16870 [Tautonia plasticadhaerens]